MAHLPLGGGGDGGGRQAHSHLISQRSPPSTQPCETTPTQPREPRPTNQVRPRPQSYRTLYIHAQPLTQPISPEPAGDPHVHGSQKHIFCTKRNIIISVHFPHTIFFLSVCFSLLARESEREKEGTHMLLTAVPCPRAGTLADRSPEVRVSLTGHQRWDAVGHTL